MAAVLAMRSSGALTLRAAWLGFIFFTGGCAIDDVASTSPESSEADEARNDRYAELNLAEDRLAATPQPYGTLQADPSCASFMPPRDNGTLFVGNSNLTAAILAEADRFWWKHFGDQNETADINSIFTINRDTDFDGDVDCSYCPDWWAYGRRAQALVQMYDLLAPIDSARAMVYLERLRELSNALLANRDDMRTAPVPPGVPVVNGRPYDETHGQVMPAWGSVLSQGHWPTTRWESGPALSGLFTYPMAAFARRVAERPDAFCSLYRNEAVKFTNAVLETYISFREDMYLNDGSPYAYYKHPDSYATLVCNPLSSTDREECLKQRWAAGTPLPWNLSFSNLKAMADVASAADSALYRSSPQANVVALYYATHEAPRLITKNVNFFIDDLMRAQFADGTTWAWWDYKKYKPWVCSGEHEPTEYVCLADGSWPEDLPHGHFTLQSLVSIWENRGVIDGLLARHGYPERLSSGGRALNPTIFGQIVRTFLRRIWRYDSTNPNYQNLLAHDVKGEGDPTPTDNRNVDSAGYVGLGQFDAWVWRRARDSVYKTKPDGTWLGLREDNHAALLRYRGAAIVPSFAKEVQSYQGSDFGIPSTWEPITGDFNGDSRTDYARVGATGAWVFLAQPGSGFTSGFQVYSGLNFGQPSQWQTVTGDFNGDGRGDYARLGATGAWVFLGQWNGGFTQGFQAYSGLNFGMPSSWEPITGDFNGDRKTDYARVGATGAWIFLGNSSGGFSQGFQAYSGLNFGQPSAWRTITADFNGDGTTDYARLGDGGAWIFTANKSAVFTQGFQTYNGLSFGLPSQWEAIAGDFNGDGKADYARVGATGAWFFYSSGFGFTQSFQKYEGLDFSMPSAWKTITGDFNGDGKRDYARLGDTGAWIFSGTAGGIAQRYHGYGGESFGLPSSSQAITGEFNGGLNTGFAWLGGTSAYVFRAL